MHCTGYQLVNRINVCVKLIDIDKLDSPTPQNQKNKKEKRKKKKKEEETIRECFSRNFY